jgi:hypothetical protein
VTARYIRTESDRRARKNWLARKAKSIWICPGCRVRTTSAFGLARHLELAGDTRGCCPVVRAEWLGQTKLEEVRGT